MPTIIDLGKRIKSKYPGIYDDISDAELGKKIKAKYPGAYDDYADSVQTTKQSIPVKKDPGIFKDINSPAYDLSSQPLNATNVAKSGANIAKSLLRFGKDTLQFFNPVESLKKVKQIPGEILGAARDQSAAEVSQKRAAQLEAQVKAKTGKAPVAKNVSAPNPLLEVSKAGLQSVVPPAAQQVFQGKGTAALQSVAEDPYQLAPAFLAAKGAIDRTPFGQTKVGKTIDATVSRVGQAGIDVVAKPSKLFTNVASSLAEFGTSQATGLNPKTIRTIIENPSEFAPSKMSQFSREGIGEQVYSKIQSRLDSLSETGKGYEAIRVKPYTVSVPSNLVMDTLNKFGIKIKDGKIVRNAETVPLKSGDVAALEDFISQYGKESQLSGNGFLNARKALSEMSKFDTTKSDVSNLIAKELRKAYDDLGKKQIKELGELDAKYAPEVKLLNKIKKDYLQADGTFKDNALTKIANLTKEGRQQILGRLEAIYPGISEKLAVLNAVEDIRHATGQKVGTYIRGGVTGTGIITGNPALIVGSILAHPKLATQILRAYGKLLGVSNSTLNAIINSSTKINNVINDASKSEPSIGLSIKRVNKLRPLQIKELSFRGKNIDKEIKVLWERNPNSPRIKTLQKQLKSINQTLGKGY